MLEWEVEGGRLDRTGDERVEETRYARLPAPPLLFIAAAERRHDPHEHIAVAPKEPDDRRVLTRPRAHRRDGWLEIAVRLSVRIRLRAACAERRRFLARRDRLARRYAGLFGCLGRDPGGIGLDGEAFQRRRQLGRRRPVPFNRREGLARLD